MPINLFELGAQPATPAQIPAAQAAQAAQQPPQPSQNPLPGETPAQYQARMAQGGALPPGTVQIENPLVAAVTSLKGGGQPQPQPSGEAPAPDERPPVPPQPQQAAGGMMMPDGTIYTPPTTETTTQTTVKPGDPRALAMVGEINSAQAQWNEAYKASQRSLEQIDRDMAQDEILKQALDGKQAELKALLDSPDTMQATVERVAKLRDQFDQAVTRSVQRVDPNKFWADRSTGDQVMGGIALLLGGLAQGFGGGGGENPAWRIIDQAITRDIEAQKFNIAQAKEEAAAFGEQINTELALQKWMDKKKVERLAQADAMIVSALSQYEARAKTVEQKRAAAGALAEAQLRFADSKRAWLEMGLDQISTTVQSQQKAGKLGAPEGQAWTRWGYAPKEFAKTAAEATQVYDRTDQLLGELENFVKDEGTAAGWDAKARGKAEQLIKNWIQIEQAAMTSGTLNEGEYQRFVQNSPIATGMINIRRVENALAMIEQAKRSNDLAALAAANAYIPSPHFGDNKKLQQMWARKTGTASRTFQPMPGTGGQ